jgi:hypothetical protein
VWGYKCFHDTHCDINGWTAFKTKIVQDAAFQSFGGINVKEEDMPDGDVELGQSTVEKFPKHLLHPGGLIEQIMDFNLAGALYPQPVFALAGAITFCSTVFGRKVRCERGTWPNLYAVCVGPTGCGKERARIVNKQLGFQGGNSFLTSAEGATSGAGLAKSMDGTGRHSRLYQMDEFGHVMARLSSNRSGPNERSVIEVSEALSPDLQEELRSLALPFEHDEVPSEAELRVAKAQLVGWLEGLFHGIQASMMAQQAMVQAQMAQQQRSLAGGSTIPGQQTERPGTYL